ncbi:MAG: PEP-CTERM sorting domain-containing protein [Paucibacter sp.]|nr:PEP-CTERM sorting domain-containing protein [Roseateles sp.]
MKKMNFAAAALLAVSSFAASAADQVLNFTADAGSFVSSFAGTSVLLDGGNDVLTFAGLAAGKYEFTLTMSSQNVTWQDSTFNGLTVDFSAPQGKNKSVSGYLESTASTPFVLTLNGAALPKGNYSGELTVTAVPEPSTYALLLAGLGAVGFVARRRSAA